MRRDCHVLGAITCADRACLAIRHAPRTVPNPFCRASCYRRPPPCRPRLCRPRLCWCLPPRCRVLPYRTLSCCRHLKWEAARRPHLELLHELLLEHVEAASHQSQSHCLPQRRRQSTQRRSPPSPQAVRQRQRQSSAHPMMPPSPRRTPSPRPRRRREVRLKWVAARRPCIELFLELLLEHLHALRRRRRRRRR